MVITLVSFKPLVESDSTVSANTRNSQVCLCLGATGPLYAGYMLSGGYSWQLFFYVEFAFAMALLILAFFFVEETRYERHTPTGLALEEVVPAEKGVVSEHRESLGSDNERHSFIRTLKPWSGIDQNAEFWLTALRSFTYFLVPQVFWVVCTYGKSRVVLFAFGTTDGIQAFTLGSELLRSTTPSQSRLSLLLTTGVR